jgi:hypothetical protein
MYMKKHLTSIIFLLGTLCLSAQNGKTLPDKYVLKSGLHSFKMKQAARTFNVPDSSYCMFTWNDSTQSWYLPTRYTYSYNADNTLSHYISEYWPSGVQTPIWQSTMTYDTVLHETEQRFDYWNASSGAWESASNDIFTFNINGNCIQNVHQIADGSGGFVNSSRWINAYNANDQETTVLYQEWESPGQWKNVQKDTTTYDTNGNKDVTTSFLWDNTGLNWSLYRKITYTWNASDQLLAELWQVWDGNAGSWINSRQSGYTYDPNGYSTGSTTQMWESGIGPWANELRISETYDNNGHLLERLWFNWGGTAWTNANWYIYSANGDCINALAIDRQEKTWSQGMLFPNPAGPCFYLKNVAGDLEIYDATGRSVLKTAAVKENQPVDISRLVHGIYYVRVLNDGIVFGSRLIIE